MHAICWESRGQRDAKRVRGKNKHLLNTSQEGTKVYISISKYITTYIDLGGNPLTASGMTACILCLLLPLNRYASRYSLLSQQIACSVALP